VNTSLNSQAGFEVKPKGLILSVIPRGSIPRGVVLSKDKELIPIIEKKRRFFANAQNDGKVDEILRLRLRMTNIVWLRMTKRVWLRMTNIVWLRMTKRVWLRMTKRVWLRMTKRVWLRMIKRV
jgi:hypothetical protein